MADDTVYQITSGSVNVDDQQVQIEAKAEDAETRAAREELKHTVISDNKDTTTTSPPRQDEDEDEDEDEEMKLRSGLVYEVPPPKPRQRKKTPDLTPPEALSGDSAGDRKVSSPKKKRAHDEVDEHKEGEGRAKNGTGSDGWVMGEEGHRDDKHRSEPQKKRARDETSPPAEIHSTAAASATASDPSQAGSEDKDVQKSQTSAAAFAASGLSKLASSSASPFASAGAARSVFGGGAASSPSPFASLGATASAPSAPSAPAAALTSLPKPTLSFGSKDASNPSPFATLNGASSTRGFGCTFGGGSPFANALGGGGRVGNFASPGAAPIIKSDKPAKPFGAPESDAEDESGDEVDGDENEGGGGGGREAEKEKEKEGEDAESRAESMPAGGEEEKKAKYRRVVVDDGEAGEATIVQVRARMYYLDKTTNASGKEELAWRERGVGNLKVNVPVESVYMDQATGGVDVKSFDATVLKESTPEEPKLVRLLMRQDSTLRVILNTVMLAGMDFQLKEGFKTTTVLFTAIEGEEGNHVQVQMKMSGQSAELFKKRTDEIKKKMKEAIP